MTAQYLDKEKVLKAMSECDGNPWLYMETRIKEGKFDAPMVPIGSRIFYLTQIKNLLESVNEKDAEIAKLKKLTALQKETIDAQGKELRYKCQMREAFEQREKKVPTAPQPSAVPTSGTGTAPKYGRTLEQKVKDLEIVMDDTRLRTYPGMAKDIGNLTLRVDNLEKGVEISHDRCLRLETAFKSLKEEVNGMSITAENGTIYSLKVKREL